MAIETQPEQAKGAGGGQSAGRVRPWWQRPAIHTAVAGAVVGYLFGHWLGNFIGANYSYVSLGDYNNWNITLGYLFAVVGWLVGLGVFNDLFRQILGRPVNGIVVPEPERAGLARYFRYSLDHKVVGIQYLVGMIIYFCTAGLFAMAIRTELLSPVHHVFSSQVYIEIVGEHGTMMMMLM
ncbi:MAG TPA: hypothetical protein VEL03_08275, partial [Streptosporangiaceae bacterium]|nr:hypothetical protein [Streptosporangiaceae bacterium]